jgi:hypothetical protein
MPPTGRVGLVWRGGEGATRDRAGPTRASRAREEEEWWSKGEDGPWWWFMAVHWGGWRRWLVCGWVGGWVGQRVGNERVSEEGLGPP